MCLSTTTDCKAWNWEKLICYWRDFPLLQNMETAYVKQSSFDKLTAGWFSWEETAYWERMISPWVSSTSSMRLHQHVWIPTVQECGSSCQLHADKLSIDTFETCAINFTLSLESNKLTGNSLNMFVVVNCVVVCVWLQKSNTNYWASVSVKCTAVVTVSARWTIELPYSLTVGGISVSQSCIAMFCKRQSAGWLYNTEHFSNCPSVIKLFPYV